MDKSKRCFGPASRLASFTLRRRVGRRDADIVPAAEVIERLLAR